MKISSNSFLIAAMAAVGGMAAANAQTVIDITGATAFRAGAVKAITAAFNSGGDYSAISDNADITAGNYQAFWGKFGTVSGLGNCIIRTAWNGSVEGIRAVANPNTFATMANGANVTVNPDFFNVADIITVTKAPSGNISLSNTTATKAANVAEMAFSDVRRQATPVKTTLSGGPVGVVVFTMIANKSWRTDPRTAAITSITSQQFRALFQTGVLPLSYFTGNASDIDPVYATGRNDGSGTRTTYLAETGFGASKPVKQYTGFDRTSSTTLPSIQLVPQDGGFLANGTAQPDNASVVWNQNIEGNGGYNSGSELRADLPKTTDNTTVYQYVASLDGNASNLSFADRSIVTHPSGANSGKIFLLSWLAVSDARTAAYGSAGYVAGGGNSTVGNAYILGYEGVRLNDLATYGGNSTRPLTPADQALVTKGQYTAWTNENLFYKAGNSTLANVFNALKGNLTASNIGSAGVPTSAMGVVRGEDGGIITPP